MSPVRMMAPRVSWACSLPLRVAYWMWRPGWVAVVVLRWRSLAVAFTAFPLPGSASRLRFPIAPLDGGAQPCCGTLLRMDPEANLASATARYRETEQAHAEARDHAIAAVVAALRAGQRPTD